MGRLALSLDRWVGTHVVSAVSVSNGPAFIQGPISSRIVRIDLSWLKSLWFFATVPVFFSFF